MQLWSSRHRDTGLVALSVFERLDAHPARAAVLPRQVRVVDEVLAEAAENLARDRAATAKAAGVVLRLDLEDLVRCAEARLGRARGTG